MAPSKPSSRSRISRKFE